MNKVLPAFEIWLWIAAISSEEDCCHKQAPTNQPHRDIQCNGALKCTSTCVDRQLHIQCEDNNDMELIYNGLPVVLNGIFCSTVWDNTMPTAKCDCDTICENNNDGEATAFTTSKATLDTNMTLLPTNGEAKTTKCPNSTTVTALGALVGLLVVLLTVATFGWVWMGCLMKNKSRRIPTSDLSRATWTSEVHNHNNEEPEQLSLTQMQMYDTIPSLPRNTVMDDEEHKYAILGREQITIPEITTSLSFIDEQNKESYSKLEVIRINLSDIKTQNNPAYHSTSINP